MTAGEMLLIPVVIGLLVITLLFANLILVEFNDVLVNIYAKQGIGGVANSTFTNVSAAATTSLGYIDDAIPVIYALLVLVAILLSFQIKSHPAFLPVMILLLIGSVFVANVFQSVIYGMVDPVESPLHNTSIGSNMDISMQMLDMFPMVAAIAAAIILIAYFARDREGGLA